MCMCQGKDTHKDKNVQGWAGFTPVVGRAEQTWWCLFSGSCGSSSTKPLMLYLDYDCKKMIRLIVIFVCLHSCCSKKKLLTECFCWSITSSLLATCNLKTWSRNCFFGHFLQRLSRIKHFQVMSLKIAPILSFWALATFC